MKRIKLYLAIYCLSLFASATAHCQDAPHTVCSPCKLDVRNGVTPYSITYDLMHASYERQLVRQLLVSQDGRIVQRLKVHREVPFLANEIPSLSGVDVNADGFQDIQFVTAQGVANTYADYWLYKPSLKRFSYLGNYPVLTRDPETHLLKTYETSQGGVQYASRQYAFRGGKLELMRSETQDEIKTSGLFRLTIKQRIHGVLKTTTQKTIRPPS